MPMQPITVCESLKRLGYAKGRQVTLYGRVFDLLSDPISISEKFVFVDGLDRNSGQLRRVTIPRAILLMAHQLVGDQVSISKRVA